MIASKAEKSGLGRKVSAAALTALVSRGVKARSACWTRLPIWASTISGTSSGFCGDEVDADALRADQADDLLDLLEERLRRVVEEEMGLVEEEDQLRLLGIADLGQVLEQLREQPEEEGRVEARRLHQLDGGEDVDDAAAVGAWCA